MPDTLADSIGCKKKKATWVISGSSDSSASWNVAARPQSSPDPVVKMLEEEMVVELWMPLPEPPPKVKGVCRDEGSDEGEDEGMKRGVGRRRRDAFC